MPAKHLGGRSRNDDDGRGPLPRSVSPSARTFGRYVLVMENVDYTDTFITVAPDSTATEGVVPLPKGDTPTVASATYALVSAQPYRYRSSDVIFAVWADRQGIRENDREQARIEFFHKPRACLRSSDLCKKFGWGIHADAHGRLALYPVDSPEYQTLASGTAPGGGAVTVKAGMRSRR